MSAYRQCGGVFSVTRAQDVQCNTKELTATGDEKLCYTSDRGDYLDLAPKTPCVRTCGNITEGQYPLSVLVALMV